MPEFSEIWRRIVAHQREEFHTRRGLPFTYEVSGRSFWQSRTDWPISRRDFEHAYTLVPIDGPGRINRMVQGPAYVWAVLHDGRIRQQDY